MSFDTMSKPGKILNGDIWFSNFNAYLVYKVSYRNIMTAWMIAKRPFPKILCPPAVNIIHGLNENNILIFLPTQILVLSIYMSH